MPLSGRELEALQIIQRYGGRTGYGTVAGAMRLGADYTRIICEGLGRQDYIDMTAQGACYITPKGRHELIRRGLLEPSEEEAAAEEEFLATQGRGAKKPGVQYSPEELQGIPGELMEVECAYCWGRGKDPFGLPGPKASCSVCGGKGNNRVMAPYAQCRSCRGSGKQLGRHLTCSVCKGRGVVPVRIPGDRSRRSPPRIAPSPATRLLSGGGRSAARASRAVSVAERVSAHITNFPGVKGEHVEALFGLSEAEAERTLQGLAQAGKIVKKGELHYPA